MRRKKIYDDGQQRSTTETASLPRWRVAAFGSARRRETSRAGGAGPGARGGTAGHRPDAGRLRGAHETARVAGLFLVENRAANPIRGAARAGGRARAVAGAVAAVSGAGDF